MNFIEKGVIFLLKKIKKLFFKYPSFFTLYVLIFLQAKILYITYHINGYIFGNYTFLYILTLLVFLSSNKLLKNKKIKIMTLCISLIILAMLIYYFSRQGYVIRYFDDINTVFLKIYDRATIEYTLIRKNIIIIISIIIIYLALYLDSKGLGGIIIIVFFSLILNAFIYSIPQNANYYIFILFYLSCSYLAINLYKQNKLKYKAKKVTFSVNNNLVINFALILSFAMISFSYICIQAFGTRNINDIISNIQNKFIKYDDIGKRNVYNLSKAGFGSKEKLGGPISLNNLIAFRVKSDKPYYLRGTVKDSYDGVRWINTYDNFIFKKNRAIFSPGDNYKKYMLGIEDEEVSIFKRNTLTPKSITIYPENLICSTLFSPYNTFDVKCGKNLIGYNYERTFLLLNNFTPTNQYTVSFYESKIGVENFIDNKVSLSYEVPEINTDKAATEYYDKNVKKKYEYYLTLPKNISKETYDLVNSLVKDCTTTEEKLQKIYFYLNNNYTYTLDVPVVPEGQEFLHYFLFNEKKGYCTYFATATVILCRIIGVPARYVEGFSMDDSKDSNGLYIVRNNKAHAWAEILISDEHNVWSVLDPVPASNYAQPYEDNSESYDNKHTSEAIEESTTIEDNDASSDTSINKYYSNEIDFINRIKMFCNFIKMLIYILLILLCLLPVPYMVLKFIKYNKNKVIILDNDKIEPLFNYSKKRLQSIGVRCSYTDTDYDFLNNIDDINLKDKIYSIISLYREEYYGERKIVDFDKKQYYNFIENYIKHRQNLFSYYYNKYFRSNYS